MKGIDEDGVASIKLVLLAGAITESWCSLQRGSPSGKVFLPRVGLSVDLGRRGL